MDVYIYGHLSSIIDLVLSSMSTIRGNNQLNTMINRAAHLFLKQTPFSWCTGPTSVLAENTFRDGLRSLPYLLKSDRCFCQEALVEQPAEEHIQAAGKEERTKCHLN